MYGENYGTNTLARSLMLTAQDLYYDMDNGKDWSELTEDAKRLMEGAITLWERMVEESE